MTIRSWGRPPEAGLRDSRIGGIVRHARSGTRRRRVQVAAAAVALVVLAAACEAVPGDFTGDRKADPVYFDIHRRRLVHESGQATPLFTGSGERHPGRRRLRRRPASGNRPCSGGRPGSRARWPTPIVYDPAGMPAGPPATPAGGATPPPTLLPVPGDYDGTGKTVPAYYDQVDASWWIMGHSGSPSSSASLRPPAGTRATTSPCPADYDGDGKTDIAVLPPDRRQLPLPLVQDGRRGRGRPDRSAGRSGRHPGARRLRRRRPRRSRGHRERRGRTGTSPGTTRSVATFTIGAFSEITTCRRRPTTTATARPIPALSMAPTANLWLAGQSQPPVAGHELLHVPADGPALGGRRQHRAPRRWTGSACGTRRTTPGHLLR